MSSRKTFHIHVNPVGLAIVLGLVYRAALRPQMLKFGAEGDEAERALPGDEFIAITGYSATRAITIDAAPETVWAWIAQMGRDHTGFYGLDGLNNEGVPSASYIRADLPAPEVGMSLDGGYHILDLKPGEYLVYGAFDLPTPLKQPMEQTVLLLLEKLPDGKTRLINRVRGYTYGKLAPVFHFFYEMVDFLNGASQITNLKRRAETLKGLIKPSPSLQVKG